MYSFGSVPSTHDQSMIMSFAYALWITGATSIKRDHGPSFLPDGSVFVLCEKLDTCTFVVYCSTASGVQ